MHTNLVQVQFRSRYGDGYGPRCYTYRTDVPLCVGDIVNVPTVNGNSEARVCRIDVPESEVSKFSGQLRTITEPASPAGNLFDDFFK